MSLGDHGKEVVCPLLLSGPALLQSCFFGFMWVFEDCGFCCHPVINFIGYWCTWINSVNPHHSPIRWLGKDHRFREVELLVAIQQVTVGILVFPIIS